MDITPTTNPTASTLSELCQQLFQLARREDEAAAEAAARVPYWAPCPPRVQGHREAARCLRETALRLTSQVSAAPPLVG